MEDERKTIYDEPEKIDEIINHRLSLTTQKGRYVNNKLTSWTEQEIEIRDSVIWDYIIRQGYSKESAAKAVFARWNISLGTARRYVAEAVKRFRDLYDDKDREEFKKTFLGRCEKILEDSMKKGQKDTAIKVLDLMAKVTGLNKETKDINLQADQTIHFDFN